jgi:hypothetical protein
VDKVKEAEKGNGSEKTAFGELVSLVSSLEALESRLREEVGRESVKK